MASGYRSAAVDFDARFDPDIMGDGPSALGFRSAGLPLRYAHIQYGRKGPDVGMRIGGVDASNLWAAKGTATYRLSFHDKQYNVANQAKTNSSGSATARVTLVLAAVGTYTVTTAEAGGGNNEAVVVETGMWLPPGSSPADWEVQFAASGQSKALFTTSAAAFSSLSVDQSAATSVSVPAASIQFVREVVTVHCWMRRAGGITQESLIRASVSASGWQ